MYFFMLSLQNNDGNKQTNNKNIIIIIINKFRTNFYDQKKEWFLCFQVKIAKLPKYFTWKARQVNWKSWDNSIKISFYSYWHFIVEVDDGIHLCWMTGFSVN